MNKFVIFLFIVWIAWKVIKSAIEEMQSRTGGQSGKQPARMPRRPARPTARKQEPVQTTQTRTGEPELRRPDRPGTLVDDMERLFKEAMERKRRAEQDEDAIPLEITGRSSQPQRPPVPEPARPRQARPPARTRRAEPRMQHREVRVERRQAVQPREQIVPPPPPRTPGLRRRRREIGQVVHGRPAVSHLLGIGRWDLHGIRRGIVLSEILGPPIALREKSTDIV